MGFSITRWEPLLDENHCWRRPVESLQLKLRELCSHGVSAAKQWGSWQQFASTCGFAKWAVRRCIGAAAWHHWWPENSCSTVFEAKFPKASCSRWVPSGSSRTSPTFRASRWRHHRCHRTGAKVSRHKECLCSVVCWSWQDCHVGQPRSWWRQQYSQRQASESSAGLCHSPCFCCDSGRWNRVDMGQAWLWWGQHTSPRSAPERLADWCHALCFCCHFGRWNCGDMGRSRLWRWQYLCPRTADKCSAGLCNTHCFCCHLDK